MRIEPLKISDFDKLLQLQEKHLVSNLSLDEQNANGFVTTPFTPELLTALQSENHSFVLYEGNILGAYVLNGSWNFYRQWPIFEYMTNRFIELDTASVFKDEKITTENSFQYGPVCIDTPFRGKGILKLLFDAALKSGELKYKYFTTFINKRNTISLAAHKKQTPLLPFDTFEFNHNTYFSLGCLVVS